MTDLLKSKQKRRYYFCYKCNQGNFTKNELKEHEKCCTGKPIFEVKND